jgi:hypothetical protein
MVFSDVVILIYFAAGPWLNSEHIAAILAILVFYLAFSSKSSLLA